MCPEYQMPVPVYLGLFLFSQAISIISGSIDDHGFCHQQQLKVTFCVHCGSSFPDSIAVSIVAGENEPNGDYQLFCLTPQWICSGSMTRTYNATSDTLEMGFIFNHTYHGGRYFRIIRERKGSQDNQQILLKPCFSGFIANASFYSKTLITVSCQHSSFNYSNSPIRIKIEDGTEYGACSKTGCFGCKRLPDGIQCLVPYIPGKAIQCILDGAIYNISAPDIATITLTAEITETISTTSKDPVYTTQDTSYTSQDTKLSTTSHENSDISTFTKIEKSTPLLSVTTIPESLATSHKIITTTVQSFSLLQNLPTALTEGSSTPKSITSTDNLPGSLNITTESPNSLSTKQEITTSPEGSKTTLETNGSRTVKEETTTEYLGTTVMPTNTAQNAAITILNQYIIDQGFCHQQDVNIQLYLNCGKPFSATIIVSIVASEKENSNNLLTCARSNDTTWNCHGFETMTGYFNKSSDHLYINFKFDFTIHTGYYVRVIYSCEGNQETKHVHLKPCFSEFNVQSTFYNETSLMINCQHSSFNYSSSLIRIKLEKGDDYGSCSKTTCNSCKRLSDGIQCIVPYTPGKIFQCILDGAVYNISISANHVTQTNSPGTTITPERITTISLYRSSTIGMTSKVLESSITTETMTSPERLSTERSHTAGLTNSTTEETFRTTGTESLPTSTNIASTWPDILSTSPNITTTSPSKSTLPNTIPTSPSIFSSSQRNTKMTTIFSEAHTSRNLTVIPTTQASSDESIIIVDKDVLNQGFCNLNGVNIDLNATCELQSSATLELYVVANEYETNANIFLRCVRYKDGTWKCHGVGSMTGKFNTSFDLLEITLNLNYTVYGGHYLRIISSCDNIQDMKIIHLKACFSGFTVNTTFYNESFINVRCQHSSFNYSNSPIRIKIDGGNDYGACSRSSCTSCTRLPNGIECKVPYIPGEELQCIMDGAIYKIPVQNMTSPGIKTTPLQIITTQHTITTPQISSTTSKGSSTESLTTIKSTPTTSQKTKPASQNTTITSVEGLTSMTSILTSTSPTIITRTDSQATSIESITTTTSIPATPTESKTTTITNIPTTSQKRTTSINIRSSSKEGITIATSSPRTSQESITSTSTVIYEESITKTTYTQTNPQESLKTTYIPTTTTTRIQETSPKSSKTTPSSSDETIPTRISTTFQERSTTTFKESKTASILTLRDGSTTMTILPTTSQERKTTTTNIPTTLLEILTTTTQSPTASQDIITTKEIITTTSQEIITTTTIPATSQKGMTTSIQTTFDKITTTTESKPTTRSITTSTKKSSETPHGNIKSTTPAEKTYGSSGMSVVQRPLINAAVFLIVVANCLKYM